jgi:hypothetical protein
VLKFAPSLAYARLGDVEHADDVPVLCGLAHALDFATSRRVEFTGRAGAAIQAEIDRHVTSALPRSKGRQPNRRSAMIREVGWDFALDVADAEQDAAIAVDEPSVQLLGCPEFYH